MLALAGSAHRHTVRAQGQVAVYEAATGRTRSAEDSVPEFHGVQSPGAGCQGAAAGAIQAILSSGAQQVSTEIPRCTP